MRKLWLAINLSLLLLAVACESPTERCRRISSEQFNNRLYEEGERDFSDRLNQHPDYDVRAPYETQQKVHRAVRAQRAAELRRYSRDGGRELDSLYQRLGKPHGAVRDSMDPEVAPPPKPSDLTWYAEHCYKGRPR